MKNLVCGITKLMSELALFVYLGNKHFTQIFVVFVFFKLLYQGFIYFNTIWDDYTNHLQLSTVKCIN